MFAPFRSCGAERRDAAVPRSTPRCVARKAQFLESPRATIDDPESHDFGSRVTIPSHRHQKRLRGSACSFGKPGEAQALGYPFHILGPAVREEILKIRYMNRRVHLAHPGHDH